MSWCILEIKTGKNSAMFKLFQSFSLNPGDWKLTNIHNVEKYLRIYIIFDIDGNLVQVEKDCERATEQIEEAISTWEKDIEEVIPGAKIICTPLAEFIDRFSEGKFIEPCRWAILKVTDDQGTVTFKLLQSFAPHGENYWELNSGITQIEEIDDSYIIQGVSGSEHVISKFNEGVPFRAIMEKVNEWRYHIEKRGSKATIEFSSVDECRKESKV